MMTPTQTVIPFKAKAEGVFIRVQDLSLVRASIQRKLTMEEAYNILAIFDGGKFPVLNNVEFPDGYSKHNTHIVGATSTMTESQWAEVVDSGDYGTFEDYRTGGFEFIKASESGLSLMECLGINEGNWLVIIKK